MGHCSEIGRYKVVIDNTIIISLISIKRIYDYAIRTQYGSSRHSYQPMTFKKPDGDPYQQSFLLSSSSLTEHCKKDKVSSVYSVYVSTDVNTVLHVLRNDKCSCAYFYRLTTCD